MSNDIHYGIVTESLILNEAAKDGAKKAAGKAAKKTVKKTVKKSAEEIAARHAGSKWKRAGQGAAAPFVNAYRTLTSKDAWKAGANRVGRFTGVNDIIKGFSKGTKNKAGYLARGGVKAGAVLGAAGLLAAAARKRGKKDE